MKTRFAVIPILLLLATQPLSAEVLISEFLASNSNGERDDFGEREDWIELLNTGDNAVDLGGWSLSDKSDEPLMWVFPEVLILPGETMLIWASGRDRSIPGVPLHTNFKLSKDGEYLGLFQPEETGATSEFSPAYPVQIADVSYGRAIQAEATTVIDSGQVARYRVLPDTGSSAATWSGTNYAAGDLGNGQPGGWNMSSAFDDSSWAIGATGIGYDNSGGLTSWVGTSPSGDCQSALRNVNTSIQCRQTFQVSDPATYQSAKLRMRYEDGFVAYINGTEVGRENFSGSPGYNSRADGALDETIVEDWTEFEVPVSLLVEGTNLLAIQGLNSSPRSSDFLLLPELDLLSSLELGDGAYFATPTPNQLNGSGTAGPLLHSPLPQDPEIPRPLGNGASPPLKVTVQVIETEHPIASVTVRHRTMWNGELSVSLNDSGTGEDEIAGDGVFSGAIPTGQVGAGQMFRWRFVASDDQGNSTTWPAYADPDDAPRYFGTVALNASTDSSELPVLEWFVEGSPSNGPTQAEFRGACYYLNRFYDNIGHQIHGQSTAQFAKKSYDFDSNDGVRFVWREGERKVKDLNLLSNYADKTKARNTMAHEIGALSGTPSHFAFPIRVELNGSFHGVMDLVEDGDDRMLERNGLDGEGALYKIYREDFLSSAQKKTRKDEDFSDLVELASQLSESRPLADRLDWAYDHVDLPATINYMVVRQLNSDADHAHKNFYLYRDTNGTGEWQPIIWDVDLCHGHNWVSGPGYFDDTLYANNPLNSHSGGNRLYNLILDDPDLRKMWTRRMRTLMDQFIQPPGTVDGYLETRFREIAASIDPDPANPSAWTDGDLNAARWGFNGRFIPNRPREEIERLVTNYIGPRRSFLYNTGSTRPRLNRVDVAGGEPIPEEGQTNSPGMMMIDDLDFNPGAGGQEQEYLILRNMSGEAVDISGWSLSGAIDHVFEGGTVVPAGDGSVGQDFRGLLHVAKNAAGFRGRSTGPSGGQRRLIQGDYSGQLSARGELIELRDEGGLLIDSLSYVGEETTLQAALRISEIQYHPTDPEASEISAMPGVGEDDFEYLELVNAGSELIELQGATFLEGIGFTFETQSLEVGERVILAKNPAAFLLRYPEVTSPVAGPYQGFLDNAGERLQLADADGEIILDFDYKDGWYPATDGSGRSLVLRDLATPHGDFDQPVIWAISQGTSGNPGSVKTTFAQAYHGWDNFHFTAEERDDPLVSAPESDADGDGRNNWEEYALGTNPRVADLPEVLPVWVESGEESYIALSFVRPAGVIDVDYKLLGSQDLETGFEEVSAEVHDTTPMDGSLEGVLLRETSPPTAPSGFYSLRYEMSSSN